MNVAHVFAHVFINARSGAGDKDDLRDRIARAFAAHGWQSEFISLDGNAMAAQIDAGIAAARGVIVVCGGDGTINAVAAGCAKAGRPLGIIAGGTFNYVARNIGLPVEGATLVDEAVAVIVRGTTRPHDGGFVNDRLFLNNAGFGLYSRIISERETDKRRFGRSRVVAFLSGLRFLFRAHPLLKVELVADGEARRLKTTTLFFGCNAAQLANWNVAAAQCLADHKLAVLSMRIDSRIDIARAMLSAAFGKLEAAENIDALCAAEVVVRTRRAHLSVAIDGEIVRFAPPLAVRLARDALSVYADPLQPERACRPPLFSSPRPSRR